MLEKEIEQGYEERRDKLLQWKERHTLQQIQWEATRRCNLRCIHCGSDLPTETVENELSSAEVVKAFESIARHFDPSTIELLSITGGEPLIRKDICFIAAALRRLGFRHITLQTNGTKLHETPELLAQVMESGITGIGINLDGLKDAHDHLRGKPGHFQQMCQLARQLRSETNLYITITTVVSKLNVADLQEIATVVENLRASRWRLIEIQPIGRARACEGLLLGSEEYRHLVSFVKSMNTAYDFEGDRNELIVELGCSGWLGTELEGIVRPYIWHCHAGVSTLGIWSNGDIGGCTDIDHGHPEGNLRTDSIAEVWENRFSAYRDFEAKRTGRCRKCDQWGWCHGGGMHLRNEANELLHCPYVMLNDGAHENEQIGSREGSRDG